MATVLYVAAESIRHLALLLMPYMPDSCDEMLNQLGITADARDFSALGPNGALVPGTKLPAPSPIFPRFIDNAGEDN